MKPGATTLPPASMTRSPGRRQFLSDFQDGITSQAAVRVTGRRAGAIDELAA
jgi:hypothetical protein